MKSFRNFLPVMLVAGSVFLGAIGCNGASAANKIPDPKVDETVTTSKGQEKVIFAGGCFWGIQAVFEHVKGVDQSNRRLLRRRCQESQLRRRQRWRHGARRIGRGHLRSLTDYRWPAS